MHASCTGPSVTVVFLRPWGLCSGEGERGKPCVSNGLFGGGWVGGWWYVPVVSRGVPPRSSYRVECELHGMQPVAPRRLVRATTQQHHDNTTAPHKPASQPVSTRRRHETSLAPSVPAFSSSSLLPLLIDQGIGTLPPSPPPFLLLRLLFLQLFPPSLPPQDIGTLLPSLLSPGERHPRAPSIEVSQVPLHLPTAVACTIHESREGVR